MPHGVRYDVLVMAEDPNSPDEGKRNPLDLSDYTRGAQSAKAGCGCLAVAVFLAAIAYAARAWLFR